LNSILFPCLLVKTTYLLRHWITPSCLRNQSITRITSIPQNFKTTRSARNSISLSLRFTRGHMWLTFISPPGELTSNGVFIRLIGKLCFFHKLIGNKWMWCSVIE
jgi:hypothetical protein